MCFMLSIIYSESLISYKTRDDEDAVGWKRWYVKYLNSGKLTRLLKTYFMVAACDNFTK